MWWVLCDARDAVGPWVQRGLMARGLDPVELVSTEALAYALDWEHRVSDEGTALELRLGDGRRLSGSELRGVVNRVLVLPTDHLQGASEADREYALQEITALFMSWLHGLPCPVLNRAEPQGLSGRMREPSEWVWLADRAGLPTSAYHESSEEIPPGGMRSVLPPGLANHQVLVIEGVVVGRPIPRALVEGCRKLARLAELSILGIDFHVDPRGEWRFAGAGPLPDLRIGEEPGLDALASALGGNGGARP